MSIALAFAALAACALLAGGIYLLLRPGARVNDTAVGLAAVMVGAVGLMLLAGPAFAGDDAAGAARVYAVTIPADLTAGLADLIVAALGAAGVWLIRRAAGWLHIERESRVVERVEAGMHAALGYARARMIEAGKDAGAVEVRSELVSVAAAYLLPKMPGAMRELGIDAEGLRERLAARLELGRGG